MQETLQKQDTVVTKGYFEGRFDEYKEGISERFDFIEEKIDGLTEALEFSHNRLREDITKLEYKMDRGFELVNTRIDTLESKIDNFDQKFSPLLLLLSLIQKETMV